MLSQLLHFVLTEVVCVNSLHNLLAIAVHIIPSVLECFQRSQNIGDDDSNIDDNTVV